MKKLGWTGGALVVLLVSWPGRSLAQPGIPPPPPGCEATTRQFTSLDTPLGLPSPMVGSMVTSVINVTEDEFIFDLNMTTEIQSPDNVALAVNLQTPYASPDPREITITSNNPQNGVLGAFFQDTFWDDDAGDVNPDPGPVTDSIFDPGGTPESPLVPEEAMGAVIGRRTQKPSRGSPTLGCRVCERLPEKRSDKPDDCG